MSSTRRTAFARTPRNPAAFAAAKAEKLTRVNKRFLDSLTSVRIEPEITTILTKCDADLQVRIGANGKGDYAVTTRTGEIIGDGADVQKIQSLGSFVNAERKAALKQVVSTRTQKILAAMIDLGNVEQKPIARFTQKFIDALRAIVAQMQTLETNAAMIAAYEATAAADIVVKNHLINTATKIRSVVGDYLMYRARLEENEVPEKLNPRLLNAGIMIWVFTRLTSQKIQLGGQDFEFRQIYFPRDPVRGLQITFREWNTPELRDHQVGILDGCRNTCKLWDWNNARVIAGISETEPDFDETHKSLANVPLLVVPFTGAVNAAEIISSLGKKGDTGFAWVAPNTTKVQDIIKFLGTVPKRVFVGVVPRPALKVDFVRDIFPDFVPAEEGSGVYPKLAQQFRNSENFDTSWFSKVAQGVVPGNELSTLRILVKDVMNVNSGHTAELIEDAVTWVRAPPPGHVGVYDDTYGMLMANATAMEAERAKTVLIGRADPQLFDRKKQKITNDSFRTARCMLSEPGQLLVKTLAKRSFELLSIRIGGWLRSFLTPRLQRAVAEVMLARLDAFLDSPIKYNRSDHGTVFAALDDDYSSDESEEEDDKTADKPASDQIRESADEK